MEEKVVLKKIKKKKNAERKPIKIKVNHQVLQGFLMFIGCTLFLVSFIFERPASVFFLALSFVFVAAPVINRAVMKIRRREIWNVEALLTVCGAAVFVLGGVYQGIWVMLLVNGEKMLADYLLGRKPKISKLLEDISSKTYHVIVDREPQFVNAIHLKQGDYIELFSGEIIPVDGYIKAGAGMVSTRDITGESKMLNVHAKDKMLSGYTLLSGNIIVEADGGVEDSTVGKMNENFKNIANQRTDAENFINKFANWVTIGILGLAIIYVLVKFFVTHDFMVIKAGVPLAILLCCTDFMKKFLHGAYLVAAYRCAERGIAIKNKSFIENSLFTENIFFRKLGVLTLDEPELKNVYPASGITKQELLRFAAVAQYKADSIISRLVVKESKYKTEPGEISIFKQLSGNGAMVKLSNGIEVLTGSAKQLKEFEISVGVEDSESKLCVAINNTYVGYLQFYYPEKKDIRQCTDSLRFAGVKHIALISADDADAVKEIATKAGIDECFYELDKETMANVVGKFGSGSVGISYGENGIACPEICGELVYGGFGLDREDVDGLIVVDNILSVLSWYNIMKDTRALIIQNIFIDLICKILIMIMLLNFASYSWLAVVLFLGIDLASKMNLFRVYKKI